MQNENDELSYALSEYDNAMAEVNKQVVDLLVEPRNKAGELARFVNNATPNELYSFAKAVEEMADALRYVKVATERSNAS